MLQQGEIPITVDLATTSHGKVGGGKTKGCVLQFTWKGAELVRRNKDGDRRTLNASKPSHFSKWDESAAPILYSTQLNYGACFLWGRKTGVLRMG